MMSQRCGGALSLLRAVIAPAILIASLAVPAMAETPDAAQAAIRAALTKWTSEFNSGDAQGACALFSAELRYDYRGFPERGYKDVCDLLQRSLSDRAKRYSYSLDIREILVSGDLAVVRLTWTLEIARVGTPQKAQSEEPGMDVFRRQTDGSWKIIRYIAYEK
jgi:steroid delta-isomerase